MALLISNSCKLRHGTLGAVHPRCTRRQLLVRAYKGSTKGAELLRKPSNDMHATEAAIKTLGQVGGLRSKASSPG